MRFYFLFRKKQVKHLVFFISCDFTSIRYPDFPKRYPGDHREGVTRMHADLLEQGITAGIPLAPGRRQDRIQWYDHGVPVP